MNKAIILGRLGKNPEIRATQNGQSVANFSVATSEKWTDKSGKKEERTEWHRIVVWGKLAELCDQYLKKGSQVCVEGKIMTREWIAKDGSSRWTTEIQASEVRFLDGKPEGREEPEMPYEPGMFG